MIQMKTLYTGVPAGTVRGAGRSAYGVGEPVSGEPAAGSLGCTLSVQVLPFHQRSCGAPVWSGYQPGGTSGVFVTGAPERSSRAIRSDRPVGLVRLSLVKGVVT